MFSTVCTIILIDVNFENYNFNKVIVCRPQIGLKYNLLFFCFFMTNNFNCKTNILPSTHCAQFHKIYVHLYFIILASFIACTFSLTSRAPRNVYTYNVTELLVV